MHPSCYIIYTTLITMVSECLKRLVSFLWSLFTCVFSPELLLGKFLQPWPLMRLPPACSTCWKKHVLEGSLQHRARFSLVGERCCHMGSEQSGPSVSTLIGLKYSPRQPCSVSFFKAVTPVHPCGSYHPVPISGVAVCSWMLLHAHSGWYLGAQRNLL